MEGSWCLRDKSLLKLAYIVSSVFYWVSGERTCDHQGNLLRGHRPFKQGNLTIYKWESVTKPKKADFVKTHKNLLRKALWSLSPPGLPQLKDISNSKWIFSPCIKAGTAHTWPLVSLFTHEWHAYFCRLADVDCQRYRVHSPSTSWTETYLKYQPGLVGTKMCIQKRSNVFPIQKMTLWFLLCFYFSVVSTPAGPASLSNIPLPTRNDWAVCVRDIIALWPASVAVIWQVGGVSPQWLRWTRVFGTFSLLWTRILCMFMLVILLVVVLPALPHGPCITVRRIFLSVVAAVETTVMFELTVAPLLSVVVLMVGAAASFSRVELVLCGGFLEVIGAQVLLGVVVPVEGLLFPQVTHANYRQHQ